MTVHVRRRTPRQIATLILVATVLPLVLAAGPSQAIRGLEPVAGSAFQDPVTQRTAEFLHSARVTPPAEEPEPEPEPRRLATVLGVDLYSPSSEALAHGFHEGSTRSAGLTPVGRATANPRGIDLPAKAADGVRYVVMPSRGRTSGATSAVDVAVTKGVEITSPVTGTVVDVSEYSLYGRTTDVMMRIRPEQNPDVLVVLFHLVDPAAGAGDDVAAGESIVAASARPLPFASQVDRWAGEAGPHVHIQVDPS